MKNLWPDAFEENTRPAAKSLLEEQARLLTKITNGIVYAEVTALGEIEAITYSLKTDFSFRFDLKGKFLQNYQFNVLTFSHDITLYPVRFRVDERLGVELGLKKSIVAGYGETVEDPEALEKFLAAVLKSERIKSVVGSIIRLSK